MNTRQLRVEIIETDRGELKILLPPPYMQSSAVAFMVVAITCFLAIGLIPFYLILAQYASPKSLLSFLLAWGLIGLPVVLYHAWSLFWTISGKEMVSVSAYTMTHRCEVFGIGRERVFDRRSLSPLQVFSESEPSLWENIGLQGDSRRPPYPFDDIGPIAFYYRKQLYRFGGGIGEEQASEIVDRLNAVLER